ncbi:hypothetical protein ABN034_15150 [Actinopolymorpha sp. B11F2]|uniref:Rv1733c family protein n=1 Tax=Actinopolymorpha sp. B11F2 TaxID=3160862 RepID=UPI0032E429CC
MVRRRVRRRSGRWAVAFARRLAWTRNPMYRTSDRVEGLLLLAVLVAALVAIPLAIGVGRTAYDDGLRQSAQLTAAGHWIRATLVETVPETAVSQPDAPTTLTTLARARWKAPDGSLREAKVPAKAGTAAGTKVPVWVNESGQAVRPPPRTDQVSDKAVATGLTSWMAMELGVVVSFLLLRWLLDRRRLASWEAEWQRVAPRWTRKLR